MKKPETIFSDQLCKVLESQCAWILNVHGHSMQRSGVPDLQVIHRRWHGFLELKMNKNKPSAKQESVAAAIELRNVPVFVFRCVAPDNCSKRLWDEYEYTLEDFEGRIVARINGLDKLLDILADLDSQLVELPICKSCGHKRREDGLCNRCSFRFDK